MCHKSNAKTRKTTHKICVTSKVHLERNEIYKNPKNIITEKDNFRITLQHGSGFPGGSGGKESAHSVGDPGSVPELGRSPGEENSCLFQCSCLENSMDKGTWQATVHRFPESQTQPSV